MKVKLEHNHAPFVSVLALCICFLLLVLIEIQESDLHKNEARLSIQEVSDGQGWAAMVKLQARIESLERKTNTMKDPKEEQEIRDFRGWLHLTIPEPRDSVKIIWRSR